MAAWRLFHPGCARTWPMKPLSPSPTSAWLAYALAQSMWR